jgi:catechol 2,3-dioxygenase-like lactoylglutathione lyase family enzyme
MAKFWFDHVHVIGPDPMKTAEFYEKILGAKRSAVNELLDGSVVLDLDLAGTSMKVRGPRLRPLVPNAPLNGIEHFSVRTDNIQEAVAELKFRGVKLLGEIKETQPGVKTIYFVAPEDVLIELLEIRKP